MRIPLLLFAATSNILAAPVTEWRLHESRDTPISGKRLDGRAIIPLRIALAQSGLDRGYEHLMAVADPNSVAYGKHWTTNEIHAAFAPSRESTSTVAAWLTEHGVASHKLATSSSEGWMGFEMSVADAEQLLSTKYYEHVNEDGDVVIVCDEYGLQLNLNPVHRSRHQIPPTSPHQRAR